MNTPPLTDSKKTRLKWLDVNDRHRIMRHSVVINDEKNQEFLPDFITPDDILRLTNSSQKKKPENKKKPLSLTSENWIG